MHSVNEVRSTQEQATQVSGSWASQASGTNKNLRAVYFVNSSLGWAVGEEGTIRVSYNGGKTWSPQSSGSLQNLRDAHFVNSMVGWVVGDGGTILHTNDGGLTWIRQTSNTSIDLSAVSFANGLYGWVAGRSSTILHTTSGGLSWHIQTPPATGHTCASISVVDFWDINQGWLACWASAHCTDPGGGVHATVNGGNTWVYQSTGDLHYTTGVDFLSATSGWAAGYRYLGDNAYATSIFHTTNGGNLWMETGSLSGFSSKVDFTDSTYGWVIVNYDGSGYISRIFASKDSGVTWTAQYNASLQLTDIHMLNARTGWAVGENGTILSYTTPPAVLSINYNAGKPGSYFTVTGSGFDATSNAVVTVNGRTLDTVPTDALGVLIAILDTSQADVGYYFVRIQTGLAEASVRFVLDQSAPLRLQEGSGEIVVVPSGIAFTNLVYLPIVQR
ncbi:MAG: hypothetical protein JXA33_12790 [Anaerolineae bacterium]|nr:hypothetical protein [Anaerolineae bacterium]